MRRSYSARRLVYRRAFSRQQRHAVGKHTPCCNYPWPKTMWPSLHAASSRRWLLLPSPFTHFRHVSSIGLSPEQLACWAFCALPTAREAKKAAKSACGRPHSNRCPWTAPFSGGKNGTADRKILRLFPRRRLLSNLIPSGVSVYYMVSDPTHCRRQ